MSFATRILASTTALTLATAAGADFVDAQFTGTGAGQSVNLTVNGNGMSIFAGQIKYTLTNSTGPTWYLDGAWTTYCTELGQNTNGGTHLYEVMDVADLPTPGAGMGAVKANMIAQLYFAAGGAQFGTDNDIASAFQIAIWEIVHDFDGANLASLDIGAGIFGASVNGTIAGHVAAFLSGAFNATGAADIMGLGNNSYQDQIIQVPAPGAIALMGLAGLAAGRGRRRA